MAVGSAKITDRIKINTYQSCFI